MLLIYRVQAPVMCPIVLSLKLAHIMTGTPSKTELSNKNNKNNNKQFKQNSAIAMSRNLK
jgi:hypothetical protein